MRLLIFIAVILGIALIFGVVYGISALLERRRSGRSGAGRSGSGGSRGGRTTVIKSTAPDDDPEFLRNLARRLAEEELKKNEESGNESNDK